jgi:hypothetical protein
LLRFFRLSEAGSPWCSTILPFTTRRLLLDSFSKTVTDCSVVYLPPYAPELNPVEYVWEEIKYHQMANYAPADLEALTEKDRRSRYDNEPGETAPEIVSRPFALDVLEDVGNAYQRINNY